MSISLPQFGDGYSRLFTACAEVAVKDKRLADLLAKSQEMIAEYEATRGPALFRVMVGTEPGNYLHVDCALKEFFRPKRAPKPNSELRLLEKFLVPFFGIPAEFGLQGSFRLPLEKLPPRGMIRSLSEEQKAAGVSIRLTAGTFALVGGPVSRIRWSIARDSGFASVLISAGKRAVFGEDYLVILMQWLTEQFSIFLVGNVDQIPQSAKTEG